ncbi:MAG: ATP-dependent DNA helicase RecG [Candidatus Eisenbacteria bacterium]|nr:ATP-dependent DNA helicase RecG [Candidatus Eisenbacteria bacterium]
MNLDDPLQFLKGVGPERARRLERLGLATLRDLLWYPPKGYMDRSRVVPLDRLVPGAEQTALVRAGNGRLSGGRGRMPVFELPLRDETGEASAVWFGQAYLARTLTLGASLLVHGKVRLHAEPTGVGRRGRPGLQFQNPEYELLGSGDADETLQGGRIVPLYGLTQGITQKSLRVLVHAALEAIGDGLVDPLPREMRGRLLLPALIDAIRALHYPETNEQAELARRRLAYDELLALQLALGWVKRARAASTAAPPRRTEPNPRFRRDALVARFVEALPYRLTGGQERVWLEIRRDLDESTPMNRLLQGDVGSGKTVVAALACLAAIEGGQQAAYLAPTEILAEQQMQSLQRWFGPLGLKVGLLLGRTGTRERAELRSALQRAEIDVVVGTHALLEQEVEFARLGLVVVDEQHRFGVLQRARLRDKAGAPHCLVMSATPIPRSLAMTLYGDLDLSLLDEMPPGRRPPETRLVPPEKRRDMLRWMTARARRGERIYIVCPLVEESELIDLKAATEMAEELRGDPLFRGLEIGLLHGRMAGDEKQAVLGRFRSGGTTVLVSTTVIEVGVDVPEATIMVVEHPERFGLAQLHQLRGRVGRGGGDSFFFLALSARIGRESMERLRVLKREASGFAVAEADLRLRGPGEVLGTAQHGLPPFRIADLTRDMELLVRAQQEAARIQERDPALESPEHRPLRAWVHRLYASRMPLFEVG